MIIQRKTIEIKESASKLKIYYKDPKASVTWRIVSYNDQPLFSIGITCPTCAFFFNQLYKNIDSITIDSLRDQLNGGMKYLEDTQIKTLSELYPNGEYDIWLTEIQPYMVRFRDEKDYFSNIQAPLWFPEDDDDVSSNDSSPRDGYYRGIDKQIDDCSKAFQFFVPMYQPEQLNEERVQYYQQKIKEGYQPTALALGILSINEKVLWEDEIPDDRITTHWTLSNYLLDGHHKIQAAHREQKSITLISFVEKIYRSQTFDQIVKVYT